MIELRKAPALRALIQRAVIVAGLRGTVNNLHGNGMVEIINGPGDYPVYHARVRFNLLSGTFDVVNFTDKQRLIDETTCRPRPVKGVVRETLISVLPDWDDIEYADEE